MCLPTASVSVTERPELLSSAEDGERDGAGGGGGEGSLSTMTAGAGGGGGVWGLAGGGDGRMASSSLATDIML